MDEKIMTVKEVAAYLRFSKQSIQRFVMRKEIPFIKVNRAVRFRLSEIDQWLRERQKGKRNSNEQLTNNNEQSEGKVACNGNGLRADNAGNETCGGLE